jgi:hypothetical protein
VTARVKLLELPERARQLVGQGVIALSAVDQLRAIGKVSPQLLDAVVEFVADGNEWAAERLAREPGWVLDSALRRGHRNVFAAHLTQLGSHEIADLSLGKKTEELLEETKRLHQQFDRYAYGLPPIRFTEADIDQARAAGVVIEFERSAPIIVDRALYRELAKTAIKRSVEELRAKVAARAEEKKKSAKRAVGQPADPAAEARREHARKLRELAEHAHGANLDLWTSLVSQLAAVDPASNIDVARFFVYALLGPDRDRSPYAQSGERVAHLAACGIRLVVGELRTDVTKTRKDGSRGALRIDYGSYNDPQDAVKWLWKFIDAARTPAELFGRALVVVCAEQYANRLVVPGSQRGHRLRWESHKDIAARALAKLAARHLPASLKQLEKAIERDEREQRNAERPASKTAGGAAQEPVEVEVDAGGDEEDLEAAA